MIIVVTKTTNVRRKVPPSTNGVERRNGIEYEPLGQGDDSAI